MAKNSFLVFNEQGANMQSDAEYQSATQRIGGVLPGLAEPEMHNKLYRQTSIMAAAIGKVLAEAGYDASDANMTALAANIKALFVAKPLDSYPVGSIYISASGVNPAQLFGGTWEQIQGRFLLASSTNYAAGSTGGEANHTLTVDEMPRHTHQVTLEASGIHSHEINILENGEHKHPFDWPADEAGFDTTGSGTGSRQRLAYGDNSPYAGNVFSMNSKMNLAGLHNHDASVDNSEPHTHNANIASVGGGQAHNNMPPYLAVYVWKRTA